MNDRILTAGDLRRIEASHADAQPPLMERAGAAAAVIAIEMTDGRPLVLAGPGNNGGDAFVVARRLREAGIEPVVLFVGDAHALPDDARRAHDAFLAGGGRYVADFPPGRFGLVVDGLFGIGLNRPVSGIHAEWIERTCRSGIPVLALDIPSGLNGDSGCSTGPCIRADRTATFIALKPGLLTADGPDCSGEITVCDLGLDVGSAGGELLTPALLAGNFTPRRRNSHKGNFGSVAILGGAPGMAGAALLAGRAALRLGTGRVYLGMLEPLAVDIVQPELMLRAWGDALAQASVLAIGPGLGQSAEAACCLGKAVDTNLPLLIDADGLNLLAADSTLRGKVAVRPAPTLLTPHPAEAARLLCSDTAAIQADRLTAARALAQEFRAHIALKGCGTIVVATDGRWFINTTGNAGLASAGSGDVLSGIAAALLAQGWPPLDALLGAVHLHGAAADACVADGRGPIGLTAGELIDAARFVLNRQIDG